MTTWTRGGDGRWIFPGDDVTARAWTSADDGRFWWAHDCLSGRRSEPLDPVVPVTRDVVELSAVQAGEFLTGGCVSPRRHARCSLCGCDVVLRVDGAMAGDELLDLAVPLGLLRKVTEEHLFEQGRDDSLSPVNCSCGHSGRAEPAYFHRHLLEVVLQAVEDDHAPHWVASVSSQDSTDPCVDI